jgi:Acyltransferase family
MLRKPDGSNEVMMAPTRIAAFDRARTFITLSVLLQNSALDYTYFGQGDRVRWHGLDLMVLFNDSYFMACMFFISGLFVRDSLTRKGSATFLRDRAWRLGVPYLISVLVLMPVAYYPVFLRDHPPGTSDFNFLHFWWHTLTIGPWPSGPAWFLWVLLALDALASVIWFAAPRAIQALGRIIFARRNQPMRALMAFMILSIAVYLPMRLVFGDAVWLQLPHFPLSIQTSRILLYTAYFFAGVGVGAVHLRAGLLAENSELARRWLIWPAIALLCYGGILGLVWVHHHWVTNFDSPPLLWSAGYGLAYAMFSAAMVFWISAYFLESAEAEHSLLDALRPSAYGIYLVHYIFVTWLQYALDDHFLSAIVKFAIVLSGTLSMSWWLTVTLRKIPVVARLI